MGVKSADQDAVPPHALPFFSLSLPWLWPDEGLSGGRRISDVMVGNPDIGDGTSSLSSSQRSIISGELEPGARSESGSAISIFDGAAGVAVVGLVKKEESFDCPALSFFCFDTPALAPEVSVRGRLRESWDSCGSLEEA